MDSQTVRHVAQLARLKLSEEETRAMTSQLGSILQYVEVLNEVDTENVEPMVHAIEVSNVFRSDEPQPSITRDAALQNAPATDGECFLVPDILQKGDG